MPITHPALYQAVYARMRDLLGQVTSCNPHGRARVYRSGDAADAGRAGADKYRTVYRSSVNDSYRWTGPRPPGVTTAKPAVGGVYTSLGLNDALLGEFSFYAFHTTLDEDVRRKLDGQAPLMTAANFPPALAAKRIFEYEFPIALRIADLSLSGQGGRDLLRQVGSAPAVKAALHAAGYGSGQAAYVASGDHSLPRAMSQAVRDLLPGYRGIKVTSARADAAMSFREEGADNVIFFGADGQLIDDLRPVREISFDHQPNGTLKERVAKI